MSESAIDTDTSGPSLEQILWRTVDRWTEAPALVDADEFAAHIADAFQGEMPAESWIARFFGENPQAAPNDMAEAIVKATRDRMHVYEFDLNQLEYVVLEEKDKFVVVSDFGQFALANDDLVSRAIEAAIIPTGSNGSAVTSEGNLDRSGAEPRAFFVRESGEVVAVDVKKIAKALDEQMVKQVSMPTVDEPMARMAPFAPVKKRMTDSREEKALRQDLRTLLPLPPPKLIAAAKAAAGLNEAGMSSAPPSGAETTVFVLMPDGSLARPAMGSATRWQQMVSDWTVRASILSMGGSAQAASSQQRFAVQSGKVIALFSGGEGASDSRPGVIGERASVRGGSIAAARADGAPIRILGDDELARAVLGGASILPGFAAQIGPKGDGYWIQPEAFFAPAESDRALVAGDSQDQREIRHQEKQEGWSGGETSQGGLTDPGQSMELAQGGSQPLQLGEITGDPWSDWALTGGGDASPAIMLAARGRSKSALLAALGRDTDGADTGVPALGAFSSLRGGDLRVNGNPVVAFRAPDGSVVVQRQRGSIRLASLSRGELAEIGDSRESVQVFRGAWARRGSTDIGERTGAIPATALASLQMALERSASAGGYKLPILRFESTADAIDFGQSIDLDSDDSRRGAAQLAGPISLYSGAAGQVAQMVLSMPFPNSGEVHVGEDLSDALQAYLGAPVLPAGSAGSASGTMATLAGAGLGVSGGGLLAFNMSRGGSPSSSGTADNFDFSALQGAAAERAQDALLTLQMPSLAPLLGRSATVSGLPTLLARALEASGEWTPGPGAPLPGGIRDFAMQGPFDLPELGELVEGTPPAEMAAQGGRPLGVGEDEIVIPMPLWAQMGRGRISATNQIMASPFAPRGHVPPLGAYQLVRPFSGPIDFTNGAPAGTPGIATLHGPSNLELVAGKQHGGSVSAFSAGGRSVLGQIAVDDGESTVSPRGRMRIGAPLDPVAMQVRLQAAREAKAAQLSAESNTLVSGGGSASSSAGIVSSGADGQGAGGSFLSQGAEGQGASASLSSQGAGASILSQGAESEPGAASLLSSGGSSMFAGGNSVAGGLSSFDPSSASLVSGARPVFPTVPNAPTGSFIDGSFTGAQAAPQRPMASALQSSLRMSNDVSGRVLPGRPSPGSLGGSSFSSGSFASGTDSSAFSSRAAALGQSGVGSFLGSDASAGSAGGGQMGDLTLVAGQSQEVGRAGAAASQRLDGSSDSSFGSSAGIRGLAPGAWSGDYRGTDGYGTWAYGPGSTGTRTQSSGGVDLSGMGRPQYPSMPTSLRFRYAGAPLWWSASLRGRSASEGSSDDFETDGTSRNRALRSGLSAANSAASMWRSILVGSAPGSGFGGGSRDLEESDAGAMDRNWDTSADRLGSLGGRMDVLAGTSLVAGGAAAGAAGGRGADSIYVAMNSAGGAGAVSAQDFTKPRASGVEMSIVAAIPPSPPPLESMGSWSGSPAYAEPRARQKKAHAQHHKEGADAVSHSKIEGSVDAVAQRIYHRIRRRIASDRERFGG